MTWADELIQWLKERGYTLRESGPRNPETGRGWYSHPCEYQRGHVRVRINYPGGIIILRDPGCTLQISRPAVGGMEEQISPNMLRLDAVNADLIAMKHGIERFESRPAYTYEEARRHFFGEKD